MPIQIGEETLSPMPSPQEKSIPSFLSFGAGPGVKQSIPALVAAGLTREVSVSREGRLYASDAGLCERKAVLNATANGILVDTPAARGYFEMGNTIEELVMDGLFQSGALLFKQYRLPDVGINLGGYIDGLVVIHNRIRVLEVKSCGKLPDVPKPHHAAQAYIYSAITGLPASLLYFSRSVAGFDGSLMMTEFALEEHQEEKRNALFRAVLASIAVRRKVNLEKPSHMVSESLCKAAFCDHTSTCWFAGRPSNNWPEATPREMVDMREEAKATTDRILSTVSTSERRNGVFKHLQMHGNDIAKQLLSDNSWADLV